MVKSERSNLGYLVDELKRLAESRGPSPNDFLFDCGDGQPYDDREMLKVIRKAARKLGFYFEGLGFHSFRRSNLTRIQSKAGASAIEAQIHAGHARVSMTVPVGNSDMELSPLFAGRPERTRTADLYRVKVAL